MLSPSEAFQIAVPRRPAVLCLKRGEETQLIAVSWFTWLNMRNQPMISLRHGAQRRPGAGFAGE